MTVFHVLTIFPEFFRGPFEHGVIARAQKAGLLAIRIHNLRDWTRDVHRTVDDRPFGGGAGMVLKPEPVFEAVESILPARDPGRHRVVLLSAQGRLFAQPDARRLARYEELVLICGRYEGVDERVSQYLADEELSIGNYVLSGGELAAAVVVLPARRRGVPARDPGLPALHAAGRVPRLARAGGAARRQSCRDPQVAPPGGA
jgi:tRNA (guanine37-N1)-methyltransferase